MKDTAVICDVDGVLLELTPKEEDLFFEPFKQRLGLSGLSRDWDSYPIRNDAEIAKTILNHHNQPLAYLEPLLRDYLQNLAKALHELPEIPQIISGADHLLERLAPYTRLGIATANLREAAQLRLEKAKLWPFVQDTAEGAEEGGHKHEILARLIARLNLNPQAIVYIGDNINDVVAGQKSSVHFIGFSQQTAQREKLAKAGAPHISKNHQETFNLVCKLLSLPNMP